MTDETMENFIKASKQAIRLNPDDAKEHYYLGITYCNFERWNEAIKAYKHSIRLKPDFVDAHYNLGLVYNTLGHWSKAIESFKQVVRIKSDDAKASYALGAAYSKLKRYQEAIEAFKQAIHIKPDFIEAHFNLAIAYYLLGDSNLALDQYKILKNLDKDQANELFNLIDSSKTEKLEKEKSIQQPVQPSIIQETKMKKDDTQLSGFSVDTVDETITKKAVEKKKQESGVSGNKMLSYLGYFALMVACIAYPALAIVIGVAWVITIVVKHLRK